MIFPIALLSVPFTYFATFKKIIHNVISKQDKPVIFTLYLTMNVVELFIFLNQVNPSFIFLLCTLIKKMIWKICIC